jgi:radical SAM superfamily enzyme YgiQ (UPF0313 family)
MLLIYPPLAKPCEPPAGIAKLSAALNAHHISHHVLDANIEGLFFVMKHSLVASDTWTRRAVKNLTNNIAALRDIRTYQSPDRYRRVVKDVNRVLAVSSKNSGILLGLADYQDQSLSPLRSADLVTAAAHPEQNPFHPYFEKRLSGLLAKSFFSQRRKGRKEKLEDKNHDEKTQIQTVGFSLNYLSQALCTFAMIGFVRKEFPGIKIVLGGGLVSSWMKRPGWKNPFNGLVDHLIAGPGERALLDLLNAPMRQHHYPPDYNSLPLQDYLSPGLILPYSGSSGCYWSKCTFCPETAEENPYILIPAQTAMAELAILVEKTKPVLVHLLDNSISPALMRALAEKPLGVPWYGFARIEKELMDLDFCVQLKRSGCVMLKLGLESGDQRVLDKMRKGIDLSMASTVLKNLRKAGIAAYVYLLFGAPPETVTEARRTLAFVVRHAAAIRFLNLAIFNMPLCGQESGEIETELFYEGDLSLYTGFTHPQGWDRKAVRRFLDNEFKRHPAIATILKNDPLFFTSNHAAFFIR